MPPSIINALQKHTLLLACTFLTVITLKLLTLAPPLLMGKIVDSLSAYHREPLDVLLWLTGAFFLAGCVQAVVSPVQTFLLSRLVQRIVAGLSIDWTGRLLCKEFTQFKSWRLGHFIKSVERGISAHEQLLIFTVTVGVPTGLEFLITGSVFYYMGGAQIFAALTALTIAYLFCAHSIIQWRRKHIDAVNAKEDELGALLFNTLRAGISIKLEDAARSAAEPLNKAFHAYAEAATRVASSGGLLSGLKTLFVSLTTGGLLVWGVLDQSSSQPLISIGQLVALFAIAGSLLLTITLLTEGYRLLDQCLADQRQLQNLLSQPDFQQGGHQVHLPMRKGSTLALAPCNVVESGIVRLSTDQPLILGQGKTLAITGPSGAGKSTLLEALAGLDQSARGCLSIDNIPVSQLTAQLHLSTLRYCPQSPTFLEGPFEHCVLFGVERSPGLDKVISQLRLDERVSGRHLSENASNISGGEAKRLSLLRLFNKPGRFNLFDVPTASIEPALAAPVWDLLFEVFAGRGLICVTHDIDHLHRFDRVIVMANGAVVEDGPWHELRDKPAVQSRLRDIRVQD